MSNDLIGVEKRIRGLADDDDDERVLGYVRTSDTDDGVYYIVCRSKPHPDAADAHILSMRYAYLTRGSGNDGWLENGINMRVEGDPAAFLGQLAEFAAACVARERNPEADPVAKRVDEEEE